MVHHIMCPETGGRPPSASSRSPSRAFTLVELLVVMGIIVLIMAFLIPALGPVSGRAMDGAVTKFVVDLEAARSIAISERTRTRVLLPVAQPANQPGELALRGYRTVSLDRVGDVWKPRGTWNRLPQGVAFDPDLGVMKDRVSKVTTLEPGGAVTAPYVEFLANGSASLDPNAPPERIVLSDAIVNAQGALTRRNKNLAMAVSVEPLTGSVLTSDAPATH